MNMSVENNMLQCISFAKQFCLCFGNRVLNYLGYVQNLEKKSKTWIGPCLKLCGKGDAAIIFYVHVHAYSLSYTDEK